MRVRVRVRVRVRRKGKGEVRVKRFGMRAGRMRARIGYMPVG